MLLRIVAAAVLLFVLGLGGFAYSLLKPAEPRTVQTTFSGLHELNFLLLGDQGVGNLRQWQVAAAMEQVAAVQPVNGVFLLGDNFYSHGVTSPEDWQWRYKFENVYTGALAQTPFFATLGNHDYYGNAMAQVSYDLEDQGSTRWQMPARDYVKTFGGDRWQALVRVAFIDTGLYARNPEDATRVLDKLLSTTSPAIWTLVVTHTPLVSSNEFSHQPGAEGLWLPLVQRHRVSAILSGHDHNMQFVEKNGWPKTVIIGVGGKSGQPQGEEKVPGLAFFANETGFGRLTVSPQNLTIRYINAAGKELFVREIQRK